MHNSIDRFSQNTYRFHYAPHLDILETHTSLTIIIDTKKMQRCIHYKDDNVRKPKVPLVVASIHK